MKLNVIHLALATTFVLSPITAAEKFSFNEEVKTSADTLVIFQQNNEKSVHSSLLKKETLKHLESAISAANFSGKYGKFIEVLAPIGSNYQRIIVAGTGDKKLAKNKLTKLGGNISAKLEQENIANITIDGTTLSDDAAYIAQGVNLRAYRFDNYRSEKREQKRYQVITSDAKSTDNKFQQLTAIEQGVFLARDLTNETATEMTPVDFANAAKELTRLGVTVKVLEPKELKTLGMGALEAVGRGSEEGARLVVAHYQGSNDAPIALVGKGITFDSGGYSIKTGSSIARMKSDMAGAAAALGTIKSMALAKAEVNVVAVMGMAANMVSETSVAPGDVVTTAEGLSVEIINTDAEGRLVLSDAMWYARKYYQPEIMVDLATLTGSKIRAVGNDYAAIFSEDAQLVKELTYAGKQVNEELWHLPLGFKDLLKSDIADLQNVSTTGPGASVAASFLQHFAGETRWVHLDIAGSVLTTKAKGEVPKGGTGFGVRLLVEWIENTQVK